MLLQVQYALEGSVAVAGLGISWLRDNLGLISTPRESEELARWAAGTCGHWPARAAASHATRRVSWVHIVGLK